MSRIKIYARIRPSENRFEGLQSSESKQICVKIGKEGDREQARFSKAPSSCHEFKFNTVFEEDASQEEVFEAVARHMVDAFLEGYNGTIFAYGQTSSGKTHTIEGSGRKFAERGLIPRVLSYVYKALEGRGQKDEGRGEEWETMVHISYMEIYQDTGYDLLNPGMRPGALMVTLPKVHVAEGAAGEVVVRGLSTHLASTEEVAQSLLFQGSTCRKVAETSMNQCSSRSHTVFTIVLTARAPGSEVFTRSKLNLVDLAGSERVAKTGAGGRILQEAKHINLSLHHLEHVIVALQQQARRSSSRSSMNSRAISTSVSSSAVETLTSSRGRTGTSRERPRPSTHTHSPLRHRSPGSPISRPGTRGGHIPYRNCMLTMVLKDSLGGNCLTAMIATLSAEERNIWESMSTCRFSQRVACISNRARRNEELDDKVVIKRLKQRISELEAEITALRSGASVGLQMVDDTQSRELTDSDRQLCHKVLYNFFHHRVENPVVAGINTSAMFQECLRVLRDIVMHALGISNTSPEHSSTSKAPRTKLAQELSDQLSASRRKSSPDSSKTDAHTLAPESIAPSVPATTGTGKSSVRTSDPGGRLLAETAAPEMYKRLHHTTTPSPNSRLSSGFWSLQDQDGSLFESSYSQQGVSKVHAPLQDAQLQGSKASQRSTPQKHADEAVSYNRHQQPSQHIKHMQAQRQPLTQETSPSCHGNKAVAMSQPISPKLTSGHQRAQGFSSPSPVSPPKVGHAHSQRSPRKRKQVTSPTSPFSDRRNPSSGQEYHTMPIQQLEAKRVEIHKSEGEKQRLKSEVRLLGLKVQEEELRGQLSHVEEQLAQQHSQVRTAQQNQAATPEQICAERIAEQHLRIKQTKLHQKLLDIQHDERMLKLGPGVRGGAWEATVSDKGNEEVVSPRSSAVHLLNELTKHEMRRSKVLQQIEKLKVSQMEKQLEFKEAATKRKLLALKQQLQSGSNSSHPAPSMSTASSTTAGATPKPQPDVVHNARTSPSQRDSSTQRQLGTAAGMKPPATAPVVQETAKKSVHKQGVRKSESDRLAVSVDGRWCTIHVQRTGETGVDDATEDANKSTAVSQGIPPKSVYKQSSFQSLLTGPPRPKEHNQESQKTLHTLREEREHTAKASLTVGTKSSIPFSNSATSTALTLLHPNMSEKSLKLETHGENSNSEHVSRQAVSGLTTSDSGHSFTQKETSRGNSSNLRSVKAVKNSKLTLPEEIKETEYMSALQRQKARVSRIRRCIAAATVIQRVWREYKQNQ